MDQPTTPVQAADQIQQASATATQPSGTIATSPSQGTSGSPDVQAGAPNTPPQVFQTPQTPQSGPQDSSNPEASQSAADAKTDLSKPVTGTPAASATNPAVHPAVQKAGVIRDIAQTLAGGPRTSYTIDPNTGTMKATQTPLSGKQIGLAIAMAALTGGIQGLGEKGPGAEGRAAAVGFNTVQQQQQQQDQQAKQQASQNYARQAAIANTNFQTHQNALRLSQMELDYHKQFVGTGEPILKNINAVGAGLATGVHPEDLMSKYNVTKDMAIADGVFEDGKNPDGSTHWENTYTVIDPNKKIELPEETAKLLSDLRVPGYFTMKDGKSVPTSFAGSAPVKAGLVVNGLAMAQSFQITEGQLNRQFAALKDGDKDANQFDVNLRKSMADGSMTIKDLQTIGNYANMPIDQAIAAMEKNKVDPTIIQQYQKLVPQDAIDQSKKVRLDREAADKSARDAQAAVDKQKAELPGQIAETAAKARIETAAAGPKAFAEESGRQHAKSEYDASSTAIKDMVKDPKINAIPPTDEKPINGVNQQYLKSLTDANPTMGAVVKAIGEGRQLQSKYGLAKEDGQRLAGIVNRAYPEYSQPKAEAYEKLLNSFTSGPGADMIEKGNTTYRHIQDFVNNSNRIGASIPGSTTRVQLGKDASQLIEEVNGAYTKGVLHEDQRTHLMEGLTSVNPAYREAAAKELTTLLSAKTSERLGTFRRGKVTSATPDFEVVSPEAKSAYQNIMGKDADPNFGTSRTGQNQNVNLPPGTTHTQKMSDGNTYPVDANGKVLGPPQ